MVRSLGDRNSGSFYFPRVPCSEPSFPSGGGDLDLGEVEKYSVFFQL